MGKRISQRMTYDADPTAVFAMYIDPAFIRHKNEKTGGFDVAVSAEADLDGGTLIASRKLPAKLPAFARRFTGESVSIKETDVWGAAGSDGVRRGTITLEFPGAPMKAAGTYVLEPADTGAVCQVEVELKASIPLVGARIEEAAGEQVARAIGAEERIGREWLASH